MKEYLFEVCANSVESCIAAQAGGTDRVELCAGIPEGGTTPSYGDIVIAREVLQKTKLHVIIRPRGGDFLYSPIEQRIMLKDIDNARRLGADGCDRILTSGQQATAELGIPLLKELQQQAAGRITLLAGCGVNETNIARIAQETGINEFHFSARETVASRMQYRKERVPMGATVQINEFERNVTTKERVKKTIGKLRAGS